MSVELAIKAFLTCGDRLPAEEMQWCLDHWDLAGPQLVADFEDRLQLAEPTEDDCMAILIMFHMFGDRREPSAFAPLCRLLLDGKRSDFILGQVITESLRNVLISTFDGNATSLIQVIEHPNADEFARMKTLEALTYLYATGLVPDFDMYGYLKRMYEKATPGDTHYLWVGWAMAVAHLGYEDLLPEVQWLFSHGCIEHIVMGYDDVTDLLDLTLNDPDRMRGFTYDRIRPYTDCIRDMSRWHCFSDPVRDAWKLDKELVEARRVLKFKDVGRNDPCPCGSGKKYKKCCLRSLKPPSL